MSVDVAELDLNREIAECEVAFAEAPDWLKELPLENTDRITNYAHERGIDPEQAIVELAGVISE